MMKTIKTTSRTPNVLTLKVIALLILTSLTAMSCQKDDATEPIDTAALTSNSGQRVSMDGTWSSGCVLANNEMILNESLIFSNKNLQIDIKGYDNLQCSGETIFSQSIAITFNNAGTTTVLFNGEQVIVNKIDGIARYNDGNVESFKQIFFIDDSGKDMYMHHALFESDGGQVNSEGYPINIIPISITKVN